MIKKLKELTFSDQRSLAEKRFVLSGVVCCLSILAVLFICITTEQSLMFAIGLAFALLFMIAVVILSLKTKHLTLGSSIMIIVANVIILPIGYFLGGGLMSGSPLWFVVGIIFVFVLFKRPLFWIFFIMSLISFGTAIFIAEAHPEMVVPLQEGYSVHLDSYIAIVCVAMISGVLFKFQSAVLEHELQKTEVQKAEIEQLNNMQNNFFSSMSHEIRTPISTIIGLNEMTMRERQLPAEVLENTLNIQNASKMLLSLINDLLDMSKIQSGKMEIVPAKYDTSKMLSEITNFHWNRAAEKNLGFDIQVGENIPPMLFGDETRIKQVIINLLTNAIKYTEEGSVTLRFSGEQNGPDSFMLRVEVEDTGIGIKRENIPHLFDPFRRVEGEDTKNIEGTGLGLSISKQLVDLMGGTITVNSIYTKGSTFRIEIPQQIATGDVTSFKKPGVLSSTQPGYQQSFEAPKASVLIVDDNEMNRIVCRKLLRATKVKVDLADSGKECLEKTQVTHYDAIFMDHEMPQMDGIETLYNIRQQTGGLCRDTPVIALTANAGSDWDAFYLDKGFSAYISKPIQSSRLEALLQACLPEDLIEHKYEQKESSVPQIYEAVSKRAFIITTDSICDLPDSVLKANEIHVMPYYINTRQGRFQDIKEIDASNLHQYLVSSEDNSARSTAASVEDYERFFGNALAESRLVLHLSSSQYISEAYSNALSAAESFGNVFVVDSGHSSSGLGMMAVRASEMLRSGVRIEDALAELEDYKNRIKMYFLVPGMRQVNTKYHSSLLTRMLINVFNMDPVFMTKKGRLRIQRFMLGYTKSTSDQFIRYSLKGKKNIDQQRLYVTFSACQTEDREHILNEINKLIHFDEVIVNRASASTFINCGPNSFGLIFEDVPKR